jgi:hypothetical protein
MGVKGAKSLTLQGGEEVRAITEGFNLCNDYKRFKISFINREERAARG